MWSPQPAIAASEHALVGAEASDASILDALLADADDNIEEDSLLCGFAAEQLIPRTQERDSAIGSVAALSPITPPVGGGQSAADKLQWQQEASRLWEERANSASKTSKARPKSNSWQRRKQELSRLRSEVARLEGELKALRANVQDALGTHVNEEQRRRLEWRQQYLSIAWKLAAEREGQLKSDALAENSRLKGLVKRHAELSRALQSVLLQQGFGAVGLPRQARLHSTVERVSLFNSLDRKLSARLPLVEEIIQSACNSPATRPADMIQVNVHADPSRQPGGSIQRSKTFPFSAKSVMEIVWQCAENGLREVSLSPVAGIRLSEHSLGVDAILRAPQQGVERASSPTFHSRGVLRRWVTDKRVLVQFACVSEWFSDQSSATSLTEEFAWDVSLLDDASRVPRSGVGTRMRSSIESTLVPPRSLRASSSRARRELVVNTVLPSLTSVVKQMDQVVENMLLDNARSATRGSV